jgi:hypothetical protein
MRNQVTDSHLPALQISKKQSTHVLLRPVETVGSYRERITVVSTDYPDSPCDYVWSQALIGRRARITQEQHRAKTPCQA